MFYTTSPWLAWDSLPRTGWPRTSPCLYIPVPGLEACATRPALPQTRNSRGQFPSRLRSPDPQIWGPGLKREQRGRRPVTRRPSGGLFSPGAVYSGAKAAGRWAIKSARRGPERHGLPLPEQRAAPGATRDRARPGGQDGSPSGFLRAPGPGSLPAAAAPCAT